MMDLEQQQTAHVEIPAELVGVGHNIVHGIIESGGVWWLLGLAALGAAGIFKRRIKQWLGIPERKK